MEVSPDAQKILSTATPEAQAYVSANAPGNKLTSGEAGRLLSTFNATKATPADVFSPANVAQTLTNPAAPYDYSDPLKLRERINTELGLGDTEKQYQDAINQLRTFDTGTTTQQFGIEQELNPMGVIRGEQATASGQRSLSRQGFADTAQALADRYNALSTEATNKFNILNTERQNLQQLMVNNAGAGITYLDTIDSATKKIENFRLAEEKRLEKKAEEVAKAEYKKALKSTALQLGIKTSGNTKEIEKRLKKYYGSQAEYNKKIQDLELSAKQIANRNAGAASGAPGSSKELSAVATALQVNNNDWGKTASYLADKGYDVSEGSVIDNELRRRNGLAPINTATTKPLSAESTKVLENAKSGAKALQTVEDLSGSMLTRGLALLPGSPGAGKYEAAKNEVLDVLTRLRTGAALTASEEEFYKKQLPTLTDSASTRAYKIGVFRDLFTNVANQIQPGAISGEGEIEVVDLATGQIGTISANEFDASKYRKTGN